MSDIDKALETQIKNIEEKTGKKVAELTKHILASPLTKHSELRDMVREEFGLGYGDANTLVHVAKKATSRAPSGTSEKTVEEAVAEIYSGKKEELLPVHHKVMKHIQDLGEFEVAPKKKYLSLRRKKQFAMVGPGSKGRLEIGLNARGIDGASRLEALPPGGMCQYRVYLSQPSEVDDELMGWIRLAYESAG